MIKQIWIAECDICGKVEKARMIAPGNGYKGIDYDIPSDWMRVTNKDMCICSNCASALREKEILRVPRVNKEAK